VQRWRHWLGLYRVFSLLVFTYVIIGGLETWTLEWKCISPKNRRLAYPFLLQKLNNNFHRSHSTDFGKGTIISLYAYMPILYRFRDITIYWSKVCVFSPFYTHPSFVWSPHKGFPWDLHYENCQQKPRIHGTPDGENFLILRLLVQYQRVTEGQTVGHAAYGQVALWHSWARNRSK